MHTGPRKILEKMMEKPPSNKNITRYQSETIFPDRLLDMNLFGLRSLLTR